MKVTADDLQRGIEFSVRKHRLQRRKGDQRPYIFHPFEVAQAIFKFKESKNIFLLALASILHDYVEDCDKHLSDKRKFALLANMFGHQVAALVEELTLNKEMYKTVGKKEYLAEHMVAMSNYALTIKLVDRWCNVADMKKMSTKFQKNYTEETNYILDHVTTNRKLTNSQWKIYDMLINELAPYQHSLHDAPTSQS